MEREKKQKIDTRVIVSVNVMTVSSEHCSIIVSCALMFSNAQVIPLKIEQVEITQVSNIIGVGMYICTCLPFILSLFLYL